MRKHVIATISLLMLVVGIIGLFASDANGQLLNRSRRQATNRPRPAVQQQANNTPTLAPQRQFTPEEQAEIDEFIVLYGNDDSTHEKYVQFRLFQIASSWGNFAVVKYFVSQGADVDAKDNFGRTPLHFAVFSGNVQVVEYLVTQGADVYGKTTKAIPTSMMRGLNDDIPAGSTPLDLAKLMDNTEMVEYLSGLPATPAQPQQVVHQTQFTAEEQTKIDDFMKGIGGYYSRKTLLQLAVYQEDSVAIVKYLVFQGADVKAKDQDDRIPLHDAARYENIEVTKFLVSQGADVNAKNSLGRTPLYEVTNVGIAEFLVSAGADVNVKDGLGGCTPLFAVTNVEVAEFLVSAGADVNVKDNYGGTPLASAALDGHIEVVKYLVSQGLDVNAKSNSGDTPLASAALNGHIDVVKYLVSQRANVNTKDNDSGRTPLHNAVGMTRLETVKYLVSQGADVNAKDNDGKTPLDYAKADVLEYLSGLPAVQQQANNTTPVQPQLPFGPQRMDIVTPAQPQSTVQFTPEEQAEIDEFVALFGNDDSTHEKYVQFRLFQTALVRGDVTVAKYLVSQGADVNAKENSFGITPLHSAAFSENVDIVKFLVSQGADVHAKTSKDIPMLETGLDKDIPAGTTPLDLAKLMDNTAMVEYWSSLPATPAQPQPVPFQTQFTAEEQAEIDKFMESMGIYYSETPLLQLVVQDGNLVIAKYLVSQADVNARDRLGNTPLYDAVAFGNLEAIKFFVSQGADVNAKNNYGSTPLHRVENLDVIKFLVSQGANVNTKDNDGRTPLHDLVLHLGRMETLKGETEMIKFLISVGADINARTGEHHGTALIADSYVKIPTGSTPLDIATLTKKTALVEYLTGLSALSRKDMPREPLVGFTAEEQTEIEKFTDKYGSDVKALYQGATLLHKAADEGNVLVAKYLVSLGASVHARDQYGQTPIFRASNVDITEYLVSQGADVNSKNNYGFIPIHGAAILENAEVAKYLIAQGTNVNAKASSGITPLHFLALRGKSVEVAEYLVSQGADVNAKDKDGKTPLDIAKDMKNTGVADYLSGLSAAPQQTVTTTLVPPQPTVNQPKLTAPQQASPPMLAPPQPTVSQTKPAVPQQVDTPSRQAVYLPAFTTTEQATVDRFISVFGDDVKATDDTGKTPLHQAAYWDIVVTKYLVSCGADVNAMDAAGTTPLHAAARFNKNVAVVEFLVSQRADVNVKDRDGNTPLHQAASNKNVEFAKFFVAKGANITAKNKADKTPLDIASEKKNTAVVEYLSSLKN